MCQGVKATWLQSSIMQSTNLYGKSLMVLSRATAPSAQIKSAFAEYVHPALDHMEKEGFSRSSEGPHLTSPVDSSRAVETLEDLRSLLMNDFHPTCAAEKRLLLSKMSSLWRLCEGLDDLDGNRSPVDDVREDGRPGSSPEPQAARLLCDDKEVVDSDSD
ncbi:hypothetical protein HPP92_021651 [Vanilla planifolia]|uniref:Uncharacterized protein n=1 Tax=Vanilla planifolia TaxID=51239 RepID=A0A835PZ90_VANPL|nr:hypothetical protein HPP92_021970 [Vanilla planifolia]KAG0463175.1 hypothetical protein HPP92_021651 [Vanilla planifolia]